MVNSVKIKSSFYCHEQVADFPKVANDFLMTVAMVQLESDFPTTVVKEFSMIVDQETNKTDQTDMSNDNGEKDIF